MTVTRVEALRRDIAFYRRQIDEREKVIARNADAPGIALSIDAQMADEQYLRSLENEYREQTGRIPVHASHRARSHTRRRTMHEDDVEFYGAGVNEY